MKRLSGRTLFLLATLIVLFLLLLGMAINASAVRSVLDNGHLMSDAWFQVTLLDAYIGFFIFYAWVVYREESLLSRTVWFVLIMTLGNMATIAYLLIQIAKHPQDQPLSELLRKREA